MLSKSLFKIATLLVFVFFLRIACAIAVFFTLFVNLFVPSKYCKYTLSHLKVLHVPLGKCHLRSRDGVSASILFTLARWSFGFNIIYYAGVSECDACVLGKLKSLIFRWGKMKILVHLGLIFVTVY